MADWLKRFFGKSVRQEESIPAYTPFEDSYQCFNCDAESTPENRIDFVTEDQCKACWIKWCEAKKEARVLACKLVAVCEPGPARDELMRYLTR